MRITLTHLSIVVTRTAASLGFSQIASYPCWFNTNKCNLGLQLYLSCTFAMSNPGYMNIQGSERWVPIKRVRLPTFNLMIHMGVSLSLNGDKLVTLAK